jgi:glycosyltransferase involved in cell wall biosynthesis
MLGRMDGAPDYSIIVPAYNEEALLPATLARLADAIGRAPLSGELVVCDNNSTDATARVAAAAGARVVFERTNQISKARNTGARAARGRHLVFVDADTEVSPGLLAKALQALESGKVCGGGSTIVMEGDRGPVADWLIGRWNALSVRRRLAAGSFLFARRDAFFAVGGFSERVYASEEIWLARALRRWGRPRGLDFVILEEHPVLTSGRKADWYPASTLLLTALLILLFPFLVRSKRFCWLWYRRPAIPPDPRPGRNAA